MIYQTHYGVIISSFSFR